MGKLKKEYFTVRCAKEDKKILEEIALEKGYENLSQYMRFVARNIVKENTQKQE